eukprot:Clim_evm44s11 gene=Clim_evmTU44s11
MDEVKRLAVIRKVQRILKRALQLDDKDVAEYVFHEADTANSFHAFQEALSVVSDSALSQEDASEIYTSVARYRGQPSSAVAPEKSGLSRLPGGRNGRDVRDSKHIVNKVRVSQAPRVRSRSRSPTLGDRPHRRASPVRTGANAEPIGPRLGLNENRNVDSYGGSKHQATDYEKWEARQLVAAGVRDRTVLSGSRAENDDIARSESEEEESDDEQDYEIDLVEDHTRYLKGQKFLRKNTNAKDQSGTDHVQVLRAPDGQLQMAAVRAGELAKERKAKKHAALKAELAENADDVALDRNWLDPMANAQQRKLKEEIDENVAGARGQSSWKAKAFGKDVTYGRRTNDTIAKQRQSLPVYSLKSELLDAVRENQILIVIGETGSGKTTQLTQYIDEMGLGRGRIACTQPRRVAAMSVAQRVADEYGCRLGEEVGYSIRFDDMTSKATRIKYMTDGMMLRECLIDSELNEYSCIILDEAHERGLFTDVLFGLMKKAVKARPDLKLIVTSATLEAEKFSEYFLAAPIFTIPGRTFPVQVMYVNEPESDYLEAALITVMQIHLNEPAGDILVFLTGQEEIDTACEILFERMKQLGSTVPELIILPVYSALPSEMQSRIFEPTPKGSRKVVIATNIAETSITIDGIYYVVDPGFVKQKVFQAKNNMDQLVVVPISQPQAKQRAGRAGRTGPGKCFRLYTEEAFNNEMLSTNVPEIQRSNMTPTVLSLKAMGINDLLNFEFMDPPPQQTLIAAMDTLHCLGALDEDGLLTRLGRRMAEFPLDPPLSKMLIQSTEFGCSEEILSIVAMLNIPNIFHRPKQKQTQADQRKARFVSSEGDHLTLLNVYRAWKRNNKSTPWCYENFIQARSMRKVEDIRRQLYRIMERHRLPVMSCNHRTAPVIRAIVSGFFFNAAKKDPQGGYKTITDGQEAFMHPSSALQGHPPEWVVYHELVFTSREYMREVTRIHPKWLVELAPAFFRFADPMQVSRHKRKERIEPLFNKFREKDEWRISKQKTRRN